MRSLSINKTNRKGLRVGYWEEYWENGELLSKGSYKNGLMDGMWEYYYENGKLWYNGYYKEGVRI